LVVRLHHAQYDGMSLLRMLSALEDLLKGRSIAPVRRFSDFVRHLIHDNLGSYQYWRELLRGTHSPAAFKPSQGQPESNEVERLLIASKTIAQPTTLGEDTTATPAIRFLAACASMLAQATSQSDVVLGCTVSGRSALPAELHDVCGPCLNEMPIRVRFPSANLPEPQCATGQIRDQLVLGAPHQTVGFDEIAQYCTSWPSDIDDFGLSVHYQNSAESQEF
ncbi:hypothetical protein EJ03DRAFT_252355, partial [Teratosphaeria nubilosa]